MYQNFLMEVSYMHLKIIVKMFVLRNVPNVWLGKVKITPRKISRKGIQRNPGNTSILWRRQATGPAFSRLFKVAATMYVYWLLVLCSDKIP